MLTQQRLKELFAYDPDTGILTRLVSTNRMAKAGTDAGTSDGAGYLRISIDRRRYRAHRLAWLYVHGEFPSAEIDHINRVRSDNRLLNLRAATKSENQQNTTTKVNNISGVKGVHWSKCAKKWQAEICVDGRSTYLGVYANLEAATAAYLTASASIHTHAPKKA
jgi:hypothetical protein